MAIRADVLRQHVERLASVPRPAGSTALRSARAYVRQQLAASGWTTSDERFIHGETQGVNIVAHSRPLTTRGPRFCLGAHLDSRAETPGADDNASAVAALLEVARELTEAGMPPSTLDLELVAFDMEECGMVGGAYHAGKMRLEAVDLVGMVSLEMLGYRDRTPGSQMFPPQLSGQYPTTGDFIGVVGNQVSGKLLQVFSDELRAVSGLKVEVLQVPDNGLSLPPTRLSDHSPFWDQGFAALMITDTSFMRNPHYHQPSDTPETLDYDFLEDVTRGCLQAVLRLLASRSPRA